MTVALFGRQYLLVHLFFLFAYVDIFMQINGMAIPGQYSSNARITSDSLLPPMGKKTCTTEKVDVGLSTNSSVQIEVCHFRGKLPGPTVVIWSGVHGGEFGGIGALHLLLSRQDPGQIGGHLIVSPVVNPTAVFGGRLGVSPLDGLNLNRVFPGKPDGKPTERLANWLFTNLLLQHRANAFVDLHSGGIDEYLQEYATYRKGASNVGIDRKSSTLARAMGMANVIYARGVDDGTSHAAAVKAGIPAILVESGQLGSRNAEDAECLYRRLLNLLAKIGTLQIPTINKPSNLLVGQTKCKFTARPNEWIWTHEVKTNSKGLWFPQQPRQQDDVKSGQLLGQIVDPASGRILEQIRAPTAGRIFFGMNGLTVNNGTLLVAIAARKRDSLESAIEEDFK